MSLFFNTEYVDCPACGAATGSRLVVARYGVDGTDLGCAVCGLFVWQGTVVDRGREVGRETVVRRVRASAPGLAARDAYHEPWDRTFALSLVNARGPLAYWSAADNPFKSLDDDGRAAA